MTLYVPTLTQREMARFRLRFQQREPDIFPAGQSFCPVTNPRRICNDLVNALVDDDGFLPPSVDLDTIILASHGLDPDLCWKDYGLLDDGQEVERSKLSSSYVSHLDSQIHRAALLTNLWSREIAELTDDPIWREMKAQYSAEMRMALIAECSSLSRRLPLYGLILISSSSMVDTAVYKLHLRSAVNYHWHVGPSQLELLLQQERDWAQDCQIARQITVMEHNRAVPTPPPEYPLSELERWTVHLDLLSRREIHQLCLFDPSLINVIHSDINSARGMSATGVRIQTRKRRLRTRSSRQPESPSRESATTVRARLPIPHSPTDICCMWVDVAAVILGSPFTCWRNRRLLVGECEATSILRLGAEVPHHWLQAACLLQALPSLSPSLLPLQCLRAAGDDPFTIFLCPHFRSARSLSAAITSDILVFLDSPFPIHILAAKDLWKYRTASPQPATGPT